MTTIRVIEYRDVDYGTAKKEVAGYFKMKGEAYASDASLALELDYELGMQDHGRSGEGRPNEGGTMKGLEVGDSLHGHRIIAEA